MRLHNKTWQDHYKQWFRSQRKRSWFVPELTCTDWWNQRKLPVTSRPPLHRRDIRSMTLPNMKLYLLQKVVLSCKKVDKTAARKQVMFTIPYLRNDTDKNYLFYRHWHCKVGKYFMIWRFTPQRGAFHTYILVTPSLLHCNCLEIKYGTRMWVRFIGLWDNIFWVR
jgi:hypothetical protein